MTLNKILGTWCRNGRYNDKINSFVELTGSCTVKIWVFADKKNQPCRKTRFKIDILFSFDAEEMFVI